MRSDGAFRAFFRGAEGFICLSTNHASLLFGATCMFQHAFGSYNSRQASKFPLARLTCQWSSIYSPFLLKQDEAEARTMTRWLETGSPAPQGSR